MRAVRRPRRSTRSERPATGHRSLRQSLGWSTVLEALQEGPIGHTPR